MLFKPFCYLAIIIGLVALPLGISTLGEVAANLHEGMTLGMIFFTITSLLLVILGPLIVGLYINTLRVESTLDRKERSWVSNGA